MSDLTASLSIEEEIRAWRSALASTGDIGSDDIEELEDHLRDEIATLRRAGLTDSEALIIATRRIGHAHDLSREYFKVNVNKLWKRLAVPEDGSTGGREGWIAAALAVGAALLSQVPYLFGARYFDPPSPGMAVLLSVWVLPSLIGWFAFRHRLPLWRILPVLAILVAVQIFAALYPFGDGSATETLVALHQPFLAWLLLLPLALDHAWRETDGAVHYLRFTAEAFIYAVLIGLGGATLLVLTFSIFSSAGFLMGPIVTHHLGIAGLYAIPVVAVVLADRKRQVIENFAPTLARIFIPLFAVSIAAFLITLAVTGTRPGDDRDLLLVMNIVLLLVVAMLFYDVSAREGARRHVLADAANLALVAVSLVFSVVILVAVSGRVSDFGASPNQAAVLGLNAILVIHLVVLLVVYIRYRAGRIPFRGIESTIVRFLPVYGAWLAAVVMIFPIVFQGA